MAVIAATIARFEGELVVLRLLDEQELVLPKLLLPPGSRVGSEVRVSVGSAEEEENGSASARRLLTELLQGKAETSHGSA